MEISVCYFKRSEKSPIEVGVILSYVDGEIPQTLILTPDGARPNSVWAYLRLRTQFSIDLEPILRNMAKYKPTDIIK